MVVWYFVNLQSTLKILATLPKTSVVKLGKKVMRDMFAKGLF